jgi:uncharacterized repeat protein (TIGR01451 family)
VTATGTATATEGGALQYTLRVANLGPNPAANVRATWQVPAGIAVSSITPSAGSCSNAAGLITCDVGELASGANVSVDIAATTSVAGSYRHTATARTDSSDPNSGNDSAAVTTTVNAPGAGGGNGSGGSGGGGGGGGGGSESLLVLLVLLAVRALRVRDTR